MKNKFKVIPFAVLSTGLLSVYGYGEINEASAKEGEVAVQLLGINDLHGQIDGTGSVYEYGKKLPQKGGSTPLLSSYLDKEEAEFKAEKTVDAVTARVQAGDMVGASPAASGLLQDEPTIKTLNEMRFEVGTLGNHEFDEGLDEFKRIIDGAAPEAGKFNSAAENYDRVKSNMELVIANVVDKETKDSPFDWKPYTIKEYTDAENEKAKIGYIGVVTEEIPTLVLKKQWEKYDILDPAATINKYAKELKEKGINAIVVLAHASATSPSDNATEVGGEVKKIIDNLDKDSGVDIIFAGHNHVITNATYKGIRVVEAAAQGKAIANVMALYDTATNDFKEITAKVTPTLDNGSVEKDVKMIAIAKDANERIKEIVNAKVAESTDVVSRATNSEDGATNSSSEVGNLITDGQLWAARQASFKADFAITNNGGIRADLDVKDGIVTWGAAQKVQPFGNVMQVIEISGENLLAALNSQYNDGEKYFLQFSGLKYTYKDAPEGTVDEKGQPIKWVVDSAWVVKEDGTEELISAEKTYTGVINDFLYGGGDGFPELTKGTLIGALDPDTEIFVNYLKYLGKIDVAKLKEARKINIKDYVEPVNPVIEDNNNETVVENNSNTTVDANDNKFSSSLTYNTNKETNSKVEQKSEEKVTEKSASKVEKSSKGKLPNTGLATSSSLAILGLGALFLATRLRKLKK